MGVVARAAKAVGMSATSAYALRRRADAPHFARAWDAALATGRDRAFDLALDRAINGYAVPRFYRGRLVAIVHRLDNRMILAAQRDPPAPPARRR